MVFKRNSVAENMQKTKKKKYIFKHVTNQQADSTGKRDDELFKKQRLFVVSNNNIDNGYRITQKESQAQTYQPLQGGKQWTGLYQKLLANDDEIFIVEDYNNDDDNLILLRSKFCQSWDEEECPSRSLSSIGEKTISTTNLTACDDDKENDDGNKYRFYNDDKNEITRKIPTLLSSHSQQQRQSLRNKSNNIFRFEAYSLEILSQDEDEDDLLALRRANSIHDDNSIDFEDDESDASSIDSFPNLEQARPINYEYWAN